MKPVSQGFPDDPNKLALVKTLGGSTGAELVRDSGGKLWVRKRGDSPEHVREEVHADLAYRAAGCHVPAVHLYETNRGPVKLAEYIEGIDLGKLRRNDPAAYAKAIEQARQGFAADALMGNWDVAGASFDNVKLGTDGTLYRIDNGGSLRFRAQGARKADDLWDQFPTELWSLRDRRFANNHAMFGSLKASEIGPMIRSLQSRRKAILEALPEDLRATVSARLEQMRDVARTYETFLGDKFKDGYADEIGRHQIGLRKDGIVDSLATKLSRDCSNSASPRVENNIEWGGLRGPNSAVAYLHDYIRRLGGDPAVIEIWTESQGGSSGSAYSKALKWMLVRDREMDPKDFYWKGGETAARKAYEEVVRRHGEEVFRTSMIAMHAFTREYLERTDFPNKDQARGTIRLVRNEGSDVIKALNLRRHTTTQRIKIESVESCSIHPTAFGHDVGTSQDVPIHRVLATYWRARNADGSRGAFLGDGENEFLAMLDGLLVDVD